MKTKKSLCENCKNKLHIEYLETPFLFDKMTGEQIKGKETQTYDCNCIYFNSNRESALDKMLVINCNQYISK